MTTEGKSTGLRSRGQKVRILPAAPSTWCVVQGGGAGRPRPRGEDAFVARMRVRIALESVMRDFADPVRRALARRAA